MNKTFKQVWQSLAILSGVLIMVLILFVTGLGYATVRADSANEEGIFTGYSEGISNSTLYSSTNTYDYNGDNPYDTDNYNYRLYDYYDLSKPGESDNEVITGSPQITVLTHGLGGNASHWSNNGASFAYNKNSIISRLENELLLDKGVFIYWAKMVGHNSFKLYDLKDNLNISSNKTYVGNVSITEITDLSKHIIVIFEATEIAANDYNNYVYEEFNYMLSKIVYDVKLLSGGKLPRINLIGHSRGGITNLQYALDHPDMVAGLYSLGTPYFGSNTADTDIGKIIANDSNGLHDIIDENIYEHYYQRWTSNHTLYQNITALALGGCSTFDYICDLLKDNLNMLSSWISITEEQVETLRKVTNYLSVSFAKNLAIAFAPSAEEILEVLFEDIHVVADDNHSNILEYLLVGSLVPDERVYENDLLVNLTSQLGYGDNGEDYGFERLTKCYDSASEYLSVPSMPAVVHNMEAQDSDLIGKILETIDVGEISSPYLYREQDDGTIKIIGIRNSALNNTVLPIPTAINGLVVTRIDSTAFSASLDRCGIKTVYIPYTVKEIGQGAFSGCSELEKVIFNGVSQLVKIGDNCFSDCINLNEIILPKSLQEIGAGAFYNCTSLTNINLDENVRTIGFGAFIDCDNLDNISVSGNNKYYTAKDGILASKNRKILIACPSENGDSNSFIVPSSITVIGPGAFYHNTNLHYINLNNVTTVRESAFGNCSNLEEIVSENVNIIEPLAFDGTKWFEDNSDIAVVGNAVYCYQGTQADIDFSNYFSISPFAAIGNANVETVTFNNAIRNIGAFAFFGCENFEEAYINNLNSIVYVGTSAFDNTASNLTIYVPQRILNEYEDNELWQQYVSKLDVHTTSVNYHLNGGNINGQTSYSNDIEYGGYVLLPTPEKEGYILEGWYESPDLSGEAVVNGELWTSYTENYNLYAKWIAGNSEFTITYHPNGGDMDFLTQTYTIDDWVTYPIPQKEGYRFMGWYHDEELNHIAGEGFPAGNTGDLDLYARWDKLYNITYVDGYSNDNPDNFIEEELPFILSNAERDGYRFMGWYKSDDFIAENKLEKIIEAKDITLYAYWEKVYTVSFNSNGGSYVAPIQGIEGEIIELPFTEKARYSGTWQYWGYLTGDADVSNFGYDYTIGSSNVTLTAQWKRNFYYVYLVQENGTGIGGTKQLELEYGDPWPTISMPTRTGYKIDGYYYKYNIDSYKIYNSNGTPNNSNIVSSRYFNFKQDIRLTCYWERDGVFGFQLEKIVPPQRFDERGAEYITSVVLAYDDVYTFTADETYTWKELTPTGSISGTFTYGFSYWIMCMNGVQGYDPDTNPWIQFSTNRTLTFKVSDIIEDYYPDYNSSKGNIYFRAYYAESVDTGCVATGTLITLADGSQVPVESLTGNEMLLVWNMYTGSYDIAPILCIDSDPIGYYEVIKLSFSDGTTVDVISEHGFWDVNLNEYVYLDKYAAEYIGHCFLKQGENGMTTVTLIDVEISTEVTIAYSPVTYGHLCYYVNGMLSMPGGIDGLFNIFEVDEETMMYDAEAMAADIEEYGLFTYEELNALVPVPEVMFEAVNGQYLKVAIGKGLITLDQIQELVDSYSNLF